MAGGTPGRVPRGLQPAETLLAAQSAWNDQVPSPMDSPGEFVEYSFILLYREIALLNECGDSHHHRIGAGGAAAGR